MQKLQGSNCRSAFDIGGIYLWNDGDTYLPYYTDMFFDPLEIVVGQKKRLSLQQLRLHGRFPHGRSQLESENIWAWS